MSAPTTPADGSRVTWDVTWCREEVADVFPLLNQNRSDARHAVAGARQRVRTLPPQALVLALLMLIGFPLSLIL